MMVLEREDRARARGATVYATIDGYGSTCDAYHRVQMDPDGEQIVRAMTLAIERSGRAIEEIGYVNFHGTSTVLNDAVESRCVRQLFGDRADRVAGSSTKSMIGHPQGASGAAGHRHRRARAASQTSCRPRSTRKPPIPPATSTSSPTAVAPRRSRRRCATAWGSARRTARWWWGERSSRFRVQGSRFQVQGSRFRGSRFSGFGGARCVMC